MQEDHAEGGATIAGAFSIGRSARAKLERTIEGLEVAAEEGVGSDSLWATMRRCAGAVTVVFADVVAGARRHDSAVLTNDDLRAWAPATWRAEWEARRRVEIEAARRLGSPHNRVVD